MFNIKISKLECADKTLQHKLLKKKEKDFYPAGLSSKFVLILKGSNL